MSENYNEQNGLNANQNVKWYKLDGESKNAILRSIELNNAENINKQEISDLAGTLGLKFLVARTDNIYGYSAHAPEIFASPFPHEEEFYMMSPIGSGGKDGETCFTPKNAIELNDEETEKLETALFQPWSTSVPLIRSEPIPLQSPEQNSNQKPDFE